MGSLGRQRPSAGVLAVLLSSTCLTIASAQAQNATWGTTPPSGNWNSAANWSPATVPTGTAAFGVSTQTSITFSPGTTSIGTLQFNAGAPAYTFTTTGVGNGDFNILGTGIVNNSSFSPVFVNGPGTFIFAGSNRKGITFFNASTAGNATITSNAFAFLEFRNASTAGNATITVNDGGMQFYNTSTAGNAKITNNSGSLQFVNTSTAGNATITNDFIMRFFDTGTAGNATITNNLGMLFTDSTTAGNATITTTGANSGASVLFNSNASGGAARMIATAGGLVRIESLSSAGTTFGSIEGAGNFSLGSKSLAVGSNDRSTEVSGVISGVGGALTKVGNGTLNLSGTNTYTGPTTVNAGTLVVNGSIATSSGVTVNNGGALGGTGTVGNTTVNAGGTISPGNSIGVLNVNGNLTFAPGSNYLVEVSPTSAGRINVSGIANLSGTVTAAFTGAFAAGGCGGSNSYTILSAGQRIGTFSGLNTVGMPSFLSANLSYTATEALLVTLSSNVQLMGNTRNQKSVAGALDARFGGGCGTFPGFANLAPSQIPAALDQISGEVHPTTAGVLADESLYVRSAVLGRLRQASYGGESSMASLTLGGPQVAFADGEELSALAYGKSPIVTKAPPMVTRPGYDVVFWAQGLGARGRFDSDGNATNARRDLAGFFTGVDTRAGPNGRIGIAAGYTGSRHELDGRGSSNVETGHLAGYGGWNFGSFNLRAGGAAAWHTIDTARTVNFPGFLDNLTAHYVGRTAQIFGEAGYGFSFGKVAIEPFAGGAWVDVKTDAAIERGGAAALNVAGTSFGLGYSTLGVRAASIMPVGDGMVLVPRASLAWQHAFSDVTPEGRLAFQAAPVPFVIAGAPIARDALLAEAGLDLAIGRSTTLGVSYVGQLARNVHDHAAKGKFSWKF